MGEMKKKTNLVENVLKKERIERGLILKNLRKTAKLTLAELANLSGLCASYISRLETGHRRYNEDIARKLANALGCEIGVLLNSTSIVNKDFLVNNGIRKDLPIYNLLSVQSKFGLSKKYVINFDEVQGKTFRSPELFGSITAFGFYMIDNYLRFEKNDFIIVNPEGVLYNNSYACIIYANDEVEIVRILNINDNNITTSEQEIINKRSVKSIYPIIEVVFNMKSKFIQKTMHN